MTNSNNNQSQSLLSSAFGVAKKLSSTGLNALSHVAPGTVSKINAVVDETRTIDGNASVKNPLEVERFESPQQMMRQHLPKVSHQLLGRHYNRVYSIASFLSPDINEKISDYLFSRLNDFTEQVSSVDRVLEEAGAKSLDELKNNPDRSQRLSHALIEQNKLFAVAQGAVSGATGVIGAAIDVPVSLALALRTVYQTGRAHGFELNQQQEQEIVEYIFKEIDLGLVAEKQTLLMGLKALKNMLDTHDVYQFQQLLGSSNDAELLKQWLVDDQGNFKYGWLNGLSRFSVVGKLTPVAGATVSAIYSWRLIEDAGQKAQAIFGGARHYLVEHPDADLSPINAYLAMERLMGQASPLLQQPKAETVPDNEKVIETKIEPKEVEIPHSDTISKVSIQAKSVQPEKTDEEVTENVQQGITTLAEQYVEPHDETAAQQPALSSTEETSESADLQDDENEPVTEPVKSKRKRTAKPKAE